MLPDTFQPQADEHVFLIGRPPVEEYLNFLTLSVGGQTLDHRILMDEWRSANDHVKVLEKQEAGWPDNPIIDDLPPQLHPLRAQVDADLMYQHTFVLPHTVGMVELDRLVVFQKEINLSYVQRIQSKLGSMPGEEDVFRLCLPVDHVAPQMSEMQVSANSFIFHSPSNDLRFLGVKLLNAAQITNVLPQGQVVDILGLMVGFGVNCLQAISIENRLILANGSHRAYALRDIGITHVPCFIQQVSRREELVVAGAPVVQQNPDLYLVAPRPPVLKDYFDPNLRKLVAVPRKLRQVKLTFGLEVTDVPGM